MLGYLLRKVQWKRFHQIISCLLILSILQSFLGSPNVVFAAASLTITPITWNVVGLDSNNVNVGPNNFPVGARVCNTGDAVLGELIADFVWDDTPVGPYTPSPFINLRPDSLAAINLSGLAAGTVAAPSCTDFYFEVSVERDADAYETTRRYTIQVRSGEAIPEFTTISTPSPRELYVEHLISQNRNSTDMVSYGLGTGLDPNTLTEVANGGTLNLMVGNTYTIKLDASTATQGYNQLEDFINFPNTIFQINKVSSYYSANSSGYISNSSDFLYADACLWDMNPDSLTYHSCIGSDGKTGGTIKTIYEVTIIGGAGTTQSLNTLIYDFSGSSFHYNSDFSSSSRYITIDSSLTLNKSFSPASIVPGGSSQVSIVIGNTSGIDVTGVSLRDPLPAGMEVNSGTLNTNQCGGTVSSTTDAGGDIIQLTGATIPSAGCTLQFEISAATAGGYTNTTESIFINEVDTKITASANLMVETAPVATGSCATPVTIAQWTLPTTGTTPPSATSVASGATALAFTNSTQNTIDTGWWRIGDQIGSPTIDLANNKYFGLEITTADYTSTKLTFSFTRGNQGPQGLNLYASSSTSIPGTPIASYAPTTATQTITDLSVDVSSLANASGETYFYFVAYNAAANSGTNNWIGINNISLKGCPPPQTIEKSFSPNPLQVNGISRLTFTLKNYTASSISNVAFSDTLPGGLEVATTPNLSSTCGVQPTIDPTRTTISLSGGTIPALTATPGSGTCQIGVDAKAASAGIYTNTSGYLSINSINLDSKATDTLTVVDPPVAAKSFSPNPIYAGKTSTLTFTISNPNLETELTGVTFTDTFPTDLSTAGTPATTCTDGSLATSTSTKIILTGARIPAGSSCTVAVPVTSSKVKTEPGYLNEVQVTSTNGGSSAIASDTLVVQAVDPSISLLKEVATSPTGPWASKVSVAPAGEIYYRIIIENTGDVPLSPVVVTDETIPYNESVEDAINACIWPSVLPVASSTQDPTATCIKGPFTAVTGTNENTGTAQGSYNGTVVTSDTADPKSKATYTTSSLSLTKIVTQTSYSTAGDPLNYTYTIINLSDSPLTGPFNLFDTNISGFTCTLESTPINQGDSITLAANTLTGTEDTITCTGQDTVTAFDVSVGSVTNTAFAKVGTGVNTVQSNSDRETVYVNKPDLVVTKTNDAGGYATKGIAFNWIFTVTNQGPTAADFAENNTILSDQLPANATYVLSTTNPTEIENINCAIDGNKLLSCTAGSGGTTIPATEAFTVVVEVTPTGTGSLTNSAAMVDPNPTTIVESNEGNNTAGDSVNVSALVDLSISKTDSVAGVAPGGTVTYTIVVSNNTALTVNDAVLTDPAVSNLTVNSVTCGTATNGASCPTVENTTVAFLQGVGIVIPTLPGSSSVTFTVSGTAGASGSIVNTAYITPPGGISDPTPSNNSAIDSDTIGALSSDLSISKTDSATHVTAGGTVTYTILVSNAGPTAADGAKFTDPSISNLTVNSVTCGSATGSAVCPTVENTTVLNMQGSGIVIPTLPNGGSVTFTVTGTAGASGSIENTASIAPPSGTTDPTSGNNSATDTDTIDPSANLSVTKTDSTSSVTAGGATTYTVVVSNLGPSAANGAIFTDPDVTNFTAAGVTCGSASGGAACPSVENTTFTLMQDTGIIIPTLPSGGSVIFTITGTAGASGSIENTASIAPPSGTTDPTPGNNTTTDTDTINPAADLTITKTDNVPGVAPGATATYTIVVRNNGPSAADGAKFTDPSVTNLTVNSVTCGSATGSASCPTVGNTTVLLMQSTGIVIPTLPSGGSVTFTVTGTAGASGSIVNTATVAVPGGTTDPTPGNNSATDTDTISDINPSLRVTKTASQTTYDTVGDSIEYTYVITNNGDVTLSAPFTISDDKIAAVTCPETPTSLAPTESLTCTASHTITQANLDAGTLVNTATASGKHNATEITSEEVSETITATQSEILGTAKQLVSGPTEVAGSPGVWTLTYQILVKNYGNVNLTNLQVTDNLATTFAGTNAIGEESTFVVTSLTSAEFSENSSGYNGESNINLLTGTDTLAPGAQGYIHLTLQVTPVLSGTNENSATASAIKPDETTITDKSQNGANPDPGGLIVPGTYSDPTPLTFAANIFDPPVGIKTFDEAGYPILQWTAVWINNSNIVAISVQSTDEIPEGATFVDDGIPSGFPLPGDALPGSITNGVRCIESSSLSSTSACYYEIPSLAFPRGRIIWEGNLGDDLGANTAFEADHEITIFYALRLDNDATSIENIMEMNMDSNNDNDYIDSGEVAIASASRIWPDFNPDPDDPARLLPQTGFAPGFTDHLAEQPLDKLYINIPSLMLEIPKLKLTTEIVGVPYSKASWDVTWLGQNVGWLNGSAFPTWSGNSVLTGHVWDAQNQPGIFHGIKDMSYGDRIFIKAHGKIYSYEVRLNRLIFEDNIATVLEHKEIPWITLLTCEKYDEEAGNYPYRRIVRAVLVDIQ